jgi:hypothetical protein
MTPTNIDYLESLFRDPITGLWMFPTMTFNTGYKNPFINEIDPLNEDRKYIKRVINHFYFRLTEKWLYKDPIYRSLLKYFRVEKVGDKGTVSMITDVDKPSDTAISESDRKYVFRYIEKHLITKRFVRRVLKEYVRTTHIKWYDLFNNTDTLKELLCHKLKKLIITTVYELNKK